MFFNNFFSCCILSTLLVFSTNSHASAEDTCKSLAGITVHFDESFNVYDINDPRTYTEFAGDTKCEIVPKGMGTISGSRVQADWVATGSVWKIEVIAYYTLLKKNGLNNETKTAQANTQKKLCEEIVRLDLDEYYAQTSTGKWTSLDQDANESGSSRTSSIIINSEATGYSPDDLKCKYTRERTGTSDTGKISYQYKSFYDVYELYNETRLNDCPSGTVREGAICVIPEREESSSCKADIEEVINGTKANAENISIYNCHFERQKTEYMSSDKPKECLIVTYKSSGRESTTNDYKIRDEDTDGCEVEPTKCEVDFSYDYDASRCFSDAGDYASYDPELEEAPTEKLPEEEEELPPVREGEAGEVADLEDGQYVECEENTGDIICNIYDSDGSYSSPAPVEHYPDGTPVSDDICWNGMTGSNCSNDPNVGGSIPNSGNDNDISGINDSLNDLLTSNGEIMIDYDKVGDEYGNDGDGDGDGGGEDDLLFEDELEKNKGSLNEIGECPIPTPVIFFEGVNFLGGNIEKEFLLEYTIICDFGDKYKDIYIAIFVMMLGLGFVKRLND